MHRAGLPKRKIKLSKAGVIRPHGTAFHMLFADLHKQESDVVAVDFTVTRYIMLTV